MLLVTCARMVSFRVPIWGWMAFHWSPSEYAHVRRTVSPRSCASLRKDCSSLFPCETR